MSVKSTNGNRRQKNKKNYKRQKDFNWYKVQPPQEHAVINFCIAMKYMEQNLLKIQGEMGKTVSYNTRMQYTSQ